jgi:hypothetical protein
MISRGVAEPREQYSTDRDRTTSHQPCKSLVTGSSDGLRAPLARDYPRSEPLESAKFIYNNIQ